MVAAGVVVAGVVVAAWVASVVYFGAGEGAEVAGVAVSGHMVCGCSVVCQIGLFFGLFSGVVGFQVLCLCLCLFVVVCLVLLFAVFDECFAVVE